MKRALRLLVLALLTLLALQLYFLLRIAAMNWIDPQSTTFQRSEMTRIVARDGRRLQRMAEILEQLMPGHTVLTLPAWDCLPYDRASPCGGGAIR